ncbi:A disintegrin and metalloproteinase with thrombospondin motifs 12-like [Fopius arisanus]|uniref:A disintegrin and metalloproteinase with thrombospondin motifs 12-like n=1 Tax=Fopius arisanus TaxID=64838 RepID=A0A9R1U2Z7_9HYME|nr:PREDICTED: A disintegrin and metalloproteinase with thrombospondin motifs 12-like [Fopius arisanus]
MNYIYHGRYTRNIRKPDLLVPRRVNEDGSFNTFSLPHFYNRAEVTERKKRSIDSSVDKLHLMLPFHGADHHVELMPYHEFISPEMVIETRGDGPVNDLNARLRFKRVSENQCHYRGFVRGHSHSRAALSFCDGVAGYIQTDHGRYFIEPMSESKPGNDGQHVHMIYKNQAPHEKDSPEHFCGTGDDWRSAWAEQLVKKNQRSLEVGNSKSLKRADTKNLNSGTHSIHRFIELGVVADKKFLDFYAGSDYEKYLLTIMNMVSDFYHDSSVGNQIDVVVVKITYLEAEKKEIDLSISPKAEKTLESFAAWSEKMNPKDRTHPNHFDISVLITRHDICSEESGCTLMGLAYVAAACDPPKAAAINEDSGLLLGIVTAHEIGHVMGCSHDEENVSGCSPQDKDQSYFLMSPIVFIYTLRWSTCSRKFITNLLESGLGECLNNDPRNPPAKYKLPDMLPGAMYDANFQCSLDEKTSVLCERGQGLNCEQLWCKNGTTCFSRNAPPAEGTKCAENKWCIKKKCVDMGSRPASVHGGWGDWGSQSACSRTCGGGVKVTERECNKPPPSNGGRYCIGERKKITICNTSPCDPYTPNFRAIQCSEFDTKPILTDGLHRWKPFYRDDIDMCALYCMNERNTFVKLAPTTKDATPCKAGTNYMCISGSCRKVGCDWQLDSDAIEDKCGVCKGDGTQCSPVEGEYTKTQLKDYQPVITIPKGARSIRIVEKASCENTLALRTEKDATFCLNANHKEQKNGEYDCGGTSLMYTHPEGDREEIDIKGPLVENIELMYTFFRPRENPGVKYTWYVMSGAKPDYVPKYAWDFTEWSKCDAKCGGGTMNSEPSCIEQQNGIVSANFCQNLPKPEPKIRVCNEQPCPAKWRVSQWSKCNACDGKKGTKHRKVQCVKPAAHPGGDDVQADFKVCKGRVPKQKEDCVGKRPCKTMCPKKTRQSNELSSDVEANNDQSIKILQSQYLKHGENELDNDEKVKDHEEKRTCHDNDNFSRPIEEDIEFRKFSTPKPGSIIQDHNPAETAVLYEVPVKDDSLQFNLSDTAFHDFGKSLPIELDTSRETMYTGAEALKLIHNMANGNMTQNGDRNYTEVDQLR